MRSDERGPDEDDLDEEDEGEEVLSLDWDSGGPGAGAGTIYVRKSGAEYRAVFPDSGETTGPYETLAEAVAHSDIGELTSACQAITYRTAEASLKELLDALSPAEARLDIDLNGEAWKYRAGRWRPRA
jgi:hypothetical protein